MERMRRIPPWAAGVIGVVATIAVWWLLAATVFSQVGVAPDGSGGAIPTPLEVVQKLLADGVDFYARNASITLTEAGTGFLFGNLAALILAALVLVIPQLENVATQVAVISYCIPIIAIGPIIRLVLGDPETGDPSSTATFLAGMSVFFTTVVGALVGLRAADRASLDIVQVYGGGRFTQLIFVRVIAALPAVLNALRIAAPAAFLGAVLGEFLGGVDIGFGPALVNAQQSLEVERAWGIALVSGLIAGAAYALIGLVARFVTPWSSGRVGRDQ